MALDGPYSVDVSANAPDGLFPFDGQMASIADGFAPKKKLDNSNPGP
jgi:hypothetical protein